MTLADLADELGVGLMKVKALLRRHFPDAGEFRAPGLTLAPEHVRFARERMDEFLRDQRTRAGDLKHEEQRRELPASVSALSFVTRQATAAPPRQGGAIRLLLHLDLISYLEDPKEPRGLKESVLRTLREMLVEGRAMRRVKSTKGTNAGWLRAALGDNGGFHFYLWHALPGQKPTKGLELQRNDVLVRAVRHHDETDWPIGADGLDDYLALTARGYVDELEQKLDRADPLSAEQRRAFSSPSAVTITMGHPGAGKTTVELERARRYEGTVLFATFGRTQAERVRRFTTTFAADGLAVDVRTIEDVLTGLDARWSQPPARSAARTLLEDALAGAPWGPWRGYPDVLFAELRAHFYGRSLPVAFRGQPSAMNAKERAEGYLRRRAEALGPETARAAANLAAILASGPAEKALFGDQLVAHDVAARLHRDGCDAVPPALRDVTAVFLDEVQDLTVVETLVFVLMVHAVAKRRGGRPGFHVAGDEGQTIRATDFDWGELKDLAALLLDRPDEYQLPGNVRSPRTLTRVVNNSWELYKAFAKTHRPRGYAEAEVFESAVGDVLWIDLSEAPDGFYRALASVPGAAVVVPDVVVPQQVVQACLRAGLPEPFSAADAKGLDFRVVAVVGAGRAAAELRARAGAASGAIGRIAQRLVVDAIRVALSRSTETLILAEQALGPEERAELRRLCSDEDQLLEGVVTRVPVAELAARLDFDETDRTALVTDLLEKFDSTFDETPERALVFAAQAREWLGDSNRSGAVQGRLRERVYEAHARALLRTAIHASSAKAERAHHFSLANRAFHLAKLPALAQLALDARDVLLNDLLEKSMDDQLRRLAEMLQTPVGRDDAAAALDLFAERAQRANPATVQAWARLLDSFEAVAPELVPELDEARGVVAQRIATACLRPGSGPAAIKLARRAMTHFEPPAELVGQLAEIEGRKADAIGIYKRAGMIREALRVSRDDGGEPRRSLELARELGDQAALATLERMAAFTSAFDALPAAELTKGEREGLLKLVRARLGA